MVMLVINNKVLRGNQKVTPYYFKRGEYEKE